MTSPVEVDAARHGFSADFAAEVLDDLYAYRRKRPLVAWLSWALLGWAGAHRFYLGRTGTALLMLLTGGGGLVWWIIDAWFVNRLVREHNAEQARRERERLPPVELAFMPSRGADVLHEPPEWAVQWQQRTRLRRSIRFAGDLLVLVFAGVALGTLAGSEGATEAVVGVVGLTAVTMLGDRAGSLERVPLLGALLRWSHRLRLFYYFNRPGSPPELLLRSVIGLLYSPFRRRDRAEVRLYLQLGGAFALLFLALDVIEDVLVPLFASGLAALSPLRLLALWLGEGVTTFVVTYAFAAPVGAVLTLYLLTRRTHRVPRLLGAFTLIMIVMGAMFA